MTLCKREELMLWRLMEFHLHRYLLCIVRRQGCEKAEQHIAFSKVLWEVKNVKTATAGDHDSVMVIHDLIADKITNHLPRTIGLDLDESDQDWDILTDKLFREILKLKI